jgi:hypothetical protein
MFKTIWQKILSIFNKTTQTTSDEYAENDRYAIQYESTRDINITAMFSNKLANYVTDESVMSIDGDNKRAELLNEILKSVLKDKKKIVSRIFGTGGITLVPYVKQGKLYYDKISQNRLSINEKLGDYIIDATILADVKVVNKGMITTTYYRWTDYKIIDNALVIEQRYTIDNGTKIEKPIFWVDINDKFVIPNVEKVPFAYIKSPIDNRLTSDLYGVPITYGCENTIRKILHTLEQIEREFDLKEAFVGADTTMFKGDGALPTTGLYKKIDSGDDTFWEVFDPAIRDSSYFNKLMNLFTILEKEVGTSRGVLTDPITSYQNVDEVKRALRDTLSIINDMREVFTNGINDFLYACDVLANYYNLSPMGEYNLDVTWSYALIEDYNTTFNQYNIGLDKGYVRKAEVRNLLMDESLEESEEVIKEIELNSPNIKDLLGTNV